MWRRPGPLAGAGGRPAAQPPGRTLRSAGPARRGDARSTYSRGAIWCPPPSKRARPTGRRLHPARRTGGTRKRRGRSWRPVLRQAVGRGVRRVSDLVSDAAGPGGAAPYGQQVHAPARLGGQRRQGLAAALEVPPRGGGHALEAATRPRSSLTAQDAAPGTSGDGTHQEGFASWIMAKVTPDGSLKRQIHSPLPMSSGGSTMNPPCS